MDDRQKWIGQAEMLVNRVRKNLRRLGPWLERERITCYRLYDRDIPEIKLAVDWYEGRLHAAVYSDRDAGGTGAGTDGMTLIAQTLADDLGVPATRVFLKRHQRQRDGSQYEKIGATDARFTVQENGLAFGVNLSDYLNTGLFLDHRRTRRMVGDAAANKRFLNLFGYTGSFTVYAAAGGATRTTTVDISNTYTHWAKWNMRQNRFSGPEHRFVRDDAFHFLKSAEAERQGPFDLVVVDPPTVSRSKRMQGKLDLQRDYLFLLNRCLRLCNEGAVVYFSTNFRKLSFDVNQIHCSGSEEITAQTIPHDFRDKRIHRCWRLVK